MTRRSTISVGATLAWLLAGVSASAQFSPFVDQVGGLAAKPGPAFVPGELVVQFREGAARERQSDVVTALGSRLVYTAEQVPGLHVVTAPPGMTVAQAIGMYAARLDVRYAEPNYLDHPFFTPNDPMYPKQWNFPSIRLPQAWNLQKGGKPGVIVAVVDSGVAFRSVAGHPQAPDLAGATFVSPYDAVDHDRVPVDDVNHGTHVTGTIAQRTSNRLGVAGVAFGTAIMPVRSLGPGGGTHAQFADGFHWAADHGAKILNYSAGGVDSQTKRDAVKYAYNHGVLVVAAMGNDGSASSAFRYPGVYPEALGVGAVTKAKVRASYSNYGKGIDIVAPGGSGGGQGEDILQNTFAQGQPTQMGYWWFAGTSMATPHVSGVAALLLAKAGSKGLTLTQLRNLLLKNTEDLGARGYDTQYGWGLVRPDLALKALANGRYSQPGGVAQVTSLVAAPTGRLGAQITFALNFDAAVTATVLNIAGRPVRALAVDREMAAGTNTLLWDGRSDAGVKAPAGTYLIRVSAQAPAGPQSSRVASLSLAR